MMSTTGQPPRMVNGNERLWLRLALKKQKARLATANLMCKLRFANPCLSTNMKASHEGRVDPAHNRRKNEQKKSIGRTNYKPSNRQYETENYPTKSQKARCRIILGSQSSI